ncbi:hypothetical protein [Cellulomonas sp.]|nr:hypothetical protein [Cellulomonas sp.]HYQ74719.1 hypothetical protein [Cellulomonas sp.]
MAATVNTMVRYLHGHDRIPGLGTEPGEAGAREEDPEPQPATA